MVRCALVCKSWNDIALDLLWENVNAAWNSLFPIAYLIDHIQDETKSFDVLVSLPFGHDLPIQLIIIRK